MVGCRGRSRFVFILRRNHVIRPQCNLKPASMRGVKSYAMVLCVSRIDPPVSLPHSPLRHTQATSKDGKEGGIEIIDPPPNAKPGDRVYFEGPFESEIFTQAVLACMPLPLCTRRYATRPAQPQKEDIRNYSTRYADFPDSALRGT